MNYTRLLGSSDTPQGLQEKRQLSNGFTDPYEVTLRMPMLKKVIWRTLWQLGSSPCPPIVSYAQNIAPHVISSKTILTNYSVTLYLNASYRHINILRLII